MLATASVENWPSYGPLSVSYVSNKASQLQPDIYQKIHGVSCSFAKLLRRLATSGWLEGQLWTWNEGAQIRSGLHLNPTAAAMLLLCANGWFYVILFAPVVTIGASSIYSEHMGKLKSVRIYSNHTVEITMKSQLALKKTPQPSRPWPRFHSSLQRASPIEVATWHGCIQVQLSEAMYLRNFQSNSAHFHNGFQTRMLKCSITKQQVSIILLYMCNIMARNFKLFKGCKNLPLTPPCSHTKKKIKWMVESSVLQHTAVAMPYQWWIPSTLSCSIL